MSKMKDLKVLARLLDYMLGRRPDEFGLLPDTDGFVKIKEFLKAASEEPGSRNIRRKHLDELIITLPDAPIEIADNRVRACNRIHLPKQQPAENLPKLLYTGIRRRAWPRVHAKGIFASAEECIVLSAERPLAERIARRKDTGAVMLTVQTGQLLANGIMILQFGKTLFSTRQLPPDCFTGPPLPKEKPQPAPKTPKAPTPGSFELDLEKSLSKNAGLSNKSREKRKQKRKKPPWRQ